MEGMLFALLALLGALPVRAVMVELPRPVPAAPALAARAAALAPLPSLTPLPPPAAAPALRRVGSLLADARAPGAPEFARAFDGAAAGKRDGPWPLIGIFDTRTARVYNGFALGSHGVEGHSDAIPQGLDRARLGGYTLFVLPDGETRFAGSGSLPAEVTPAVRRSVLRHYGLRPAEESLPSRAVRLALRAWDGLIALLRA